MKHFSNKPLTIATKIIMSLEPLKPESNIIVSVHLVSELHRLNMLSLTLW